MALLGNVSTRLSDRNSGAWVSSVHAGAAEGHGRAAMISQQNSRQCLERSQKEFMAPRLRSRCGWGMVGMKRAAGGRV